MTINLKPKKVEYCSLAFDDVARIHKHSNLLPEKDDVIKDLKVNLDDLGFRFHSTAKRTITILNTFIPELMLDVLKESARHAEYEAYIVNNKRAVFDSIKECVYRMSEKKARYCFDLRSSEIIELSESEGYIKFGIVTWDEHFTKEDFRSQILSAYAEFEDIQKTIYPDGAIVSEKTFDKYLAYHTKIRSDDYFVAKIVEVAMEAEDSRRSEIIESYARIVSALSDEVKGNLQYKVEEILSKTNVKIA